MIQFEEHNSSDGLVKNHQLEKKNNLAYCRYPKNTTSYSKPFNDTFYKPIHF